MSSTFNVYAGPCLKIPEGKIEEVRRLLDTNNLYKFFHLPRDGNEKPLPYLMPNRDIPGIERDMDYSRDRDNKPLVLNRDSTLHSDWIRFFEWVAANNLWQELEIVGIDARLIEWAVIPYWL